MSGHVRLSTEGSMEDHCYYPWGGGNPLRKCGSPQINKLHWIEKGTPPLVPVDKANMSKGIIQVSGPLMLLGSDIVTMTGYCALFKLKVAVLSKLNLLCGMTSPRALDSNSNSVSSVLGMQPRAAQHLPRLSEHNGHSSTAGHSSGKGKCWEQPFAI